MKSMEPWPDSSDSFDRVGTLWLVSQCLGQSEATRRVSLPGTSSGLLQHVHCALLPALAFLEIGEWPLSTHTECSPDEGLVGLSG